MRFAFKALSVHYAYKTFENHGLSPLLPPKIITIIIGCPPPKEVWYLVFTCVTGRSAQVAHVHKVN